MYRVMKVLGAGLDLELEDHMLEWAAEGESNLKGEQRHILEKIIDYAERDNEKAGGEQLRNYLLRWPKCIYGRTTAAVLCLKTARFLSEDQKTVKLI